MSPNKPPFPTPLDINHRLYFRRTEIEAYKQALIAWASGAHAPQALPSDTKPTVEEFIPAERVARELGVGRRTIGRRIAGSPEGATNNGCPKIAEAV